MANEELTEFEKAIDSVALLAGLVKAYYDALIEQGMTKKDALYLTGEYQKQLLSGLGKQG